MIKAKITVGTCYGDVIIPVEVLKKGSRPGTAWVRALNGLEPFAKTSQGGPYQDSTAIVLVPHLHEVHIEKDSEKSRYEGMTQENGCEIQLPVPEQHIPALNQNLSEDGWFLESNNTVCTQRLEGREP